MHFSTTTLLALLPVFGLALPQVDADTPLVKVNMYHDSPGCPADYDGIASTYKGDESICTGGNIEPYQQIKATGLKAAGMKLLVYHDVGCASLATNGEITEDDICYTAPADNAIAAWSVVNV